MRYDNQIDVTLTQKWRDSQPMWNKLNWIEIVKWKQRRQQQQQHRNYFTTVISSGISIRICVFGVMYGADTNIQSIKYWAIEWRNENTATQTLLILIISHGDAARCLNKFPFLMTYKLSHTHTAIEIIPSSGCSTLHQCWQTKQAKTCSFCSLVLSFLSVLNWVRSCPFSFWRSQCVHKRIVDCLPFIEQFDLNPSITSIPINKWPLLYCSIIDLPSKIPLKFQHKRINLHT